jgi:ankyrin repeat protein
MAEEQLAVSEDESQETAATFEDALNEMRAAMDKAYSNEALIAACRDGDIMRAKLAVSNGADRTVTDEDGNTPMHLAALSGNRELTTFLLAEKFAFDLSNKAGFTPLANAISGGHVEIADDLSVAGANVNHALALNETLLMMAAYRDLPAIVAGLIKHGAAVDAQDKNGVSAAMRAAGQNSALCLKLIMDGGANPYLTSKSGRTAYDFAKRTRAADTMTYLDNYLTEYATRTAEKGQEHGTTAMKKISFRKPDGYIPLS